MWIVEYFNPIKVAYKRWTIKVIKGGTRKWSVLARFTSQYKFTQLVFKSSKLANDLLVHSLISKWFALLSQVREKNKGRESERENESESSSYTIQETRTRENTLLQLLRNHFLHSFISCFVLLLLFVFTSKFCFLIPLSDILYSFFYYRFYSVLFICVMVIWMR